MAKKNVELGQSGLGDISDILHNRGISDLSWLDINSDDYHQAEALPKQNLDIIPELQRALTFEDDEKVPSLIPLRPHTMVNTNPLDPPGAPSRNVSPEIVNRVAKYLIAGMGPKDINERLSLEFSSRQLQMVGQEISSLMNERGLIGNVFIDAKHFPRCAQNGTDKKFVAAKARQAKFVVAKEECVGCIHNHNGMCSNLHKQIVGEMSYDRRVFATYAVQLAQEGRIDKSQVGTAIAGSNQDRKRCLQASFCSTPANFGVDGETHVRLRQQDKVQKRVYSEKEILEHLSHKVEADKVITHGVAAASRHIMYGGDPQVLLLSTDKEVRRVASEHGLLGHTYLDMDALGGCKKTLEFIKTAGKTPDFVIRRSACCGECKDASDGACSKIKSMAQISDNSDDINKEHFVAALLRAVNREAITIHQARTAAGKAKKANWRKLTAQANLVTKKTANKGYGGATISAYAGTPVPSREVSKTSFVDPDEIRRTVSHFMNCGMSGKVLKKAILNRYAKSDLQHASHVGAALAKHDGIQGSYFIDPTIYPDYGKGCVAGSKQFRKRGALNVMVGEACVGCMLQTAPGWCSKYAKNLISGIPESVVQEAREAKKHTVETSVPAGVPDDINPVVEYGIASDELVVSPSEKRVSPAISFADKSLTE